MTTLADDLASHHPPPTRPTAPSRRWRASDLTRATQATMSATDAVPDNGEFGDKFGGYSSVSCFCAERRGRRFGRRQIPNGAVEGAMPGGATGDPSATAPVGTNDFGGFSSFEYPTPAASGDGSGEEVPSPGGDGRFGAFSSIDGAMQQAGLLHLTPRQKPGSHRDAPTNVLAFAFAVTGSGTGPLTTTKAPVASSTSQQRVRVGWKALSMQARRQRGDEGWRKPERDPPADPRPTGGGHGREIIGGPEVTRGEGGRRVLIRCRGEQVGGKGRQGSIYINMWPT
ncbi:hypothetical protein ACHAWF_003786 [Thalassiosira exigua]